MHFILAIRSGALPRACRGRFLAVSVDLEAKEDHGFHGLKRIRGKRLTTSPGAPGNNGKWDICLVGTAGICDAELGWSMDLADGIGNGRVRKPRIRVTKTLQNLPQTPRQSSSGEDIGRGKLLRRQCFEYFFHESLHFEWFG